MLQALPRLLVMPNTVAEVGQASIHQVEEVRYLVVVVVVLAEQLIMVLREGLGEAIPQAVEEQPLLTLKGMAGLGLAELLGVVTAAEVARPVVQVEGQVVMEGLAAPLAGVEVLVEWEVQAKVKLAVPGAQVAEAR